MLKLYYAADTCSLATHIVLEEAGADYSTVRIDFATGQQRSPDYLAINPKGRVPVLVTDRGILTETPAMLVFVAQSFPAARLAPFDDAFALAEVQAFNSYLCSTLHVAHAHRMRGHRWADDEAAIVAMQRKVPQSVTACYDLIERDMLKGPWVRSLSLHPGAMAGAGRRRSQTHSPRCRSSAPRVGARRRTQSDRRGARLGLVGSGDRADSILWIDAVNN
jgi:glutathione S-transferase